MMSREYPIECNCSHRAERFQLSFARKAMEILPQGKEIAFQTTARGLTVLGETEMALERPLNILREVYGEQLRVDPPAVRYQTNALVEEPHMGLRVLCAPAQFEPLRHDLFQRRASILDAEVTVQFGILRASAPLRSLVGYPTHVSQLTDGKARLVMWLSHYEPMDPPPGKDAA
jgi:predicted membrane GTPase involved in stress response